MRSPTSNPITLPFGSTEPPYSAASPHRGTDFSYLPDDTIYAPVDGRVDQVPNNGNDGNGTYMTSGDLFIGMLHASRYLVPNGTVVKAGDPIAVMGDSGYAQGKHLHLAVKRNGVFIDPMSVITKEDSTITIPDGKEVTEAFLKYQGTEPTEAQYKYYTTNDKWMLYYDLINVVDGYYHEAIADAKELTPGTYKFIVK